jgi:putative tryptophan/tyrosine transport system substrate-binding protein
MKQNLKFIIIMGMIFSLVAMVIFKAKLKNIETVSNCSTEQVEGKKYRIAIMMQLTHPALEEIQQGFLETLTGVVAYTYDVYNAQGDRTLMRHQAEEAVSKNYDLIFTVPTAPSLIMKEVTQQRRKDIPIVAGAVDDPVGIKLIASMQSSGNNITVVTGCDEFEQQVDLLSFLKPSLKSLLLVYNPTPGLEKQRNTLQRLFEKKDIKFKTVEIFNINDLIQKVPTFIHECDTVMVLKDNMTVSGIESLVSLCNKMGKTLYASDLNSGDKGAALSYGVREYQDGVESAYKAIEILKNGKKPTDIPSSANVGFKIKVNTKTMAQQDLDLNKELLFLMKSGVVV